MGIDKGSVNIDLLYYSHRQKMTAVETQAALTRTTEMTAPDAEQKNNNSVTPDNAVSISLKGAKFPPPRFNQSYIIGLNLILLSNKTHKHLLLSVLIENSVDQSKYRLFW